MKLMSTFTANKELLLAHRKSINSIDEELKEGRRGLQYEIVENLSAESAASVLTNEQLFALQSLADKKTEAIRQKKRSL